MTCTMVRIARQEIYLSETEMLEAARARVARAFKTTTEVKA
jgi:hypothetical protein